MMPSFSSTNAGNSYRSIRSESNSTAVSMNGGSGQLQRPGRVTTVSSLGKELKHLQASEPFTIVTS